MRHLSSRERPVEPLSLPCPCKSLRLSFAGTPPWCTPPGPFFPTMGDGHCSPAHLEGNSWKTSSTSSPLPDFLGTATALLPGSPHLRAGFSLRAGPAAGPFGPLPPPPPPGSESEALPGEAERGGRLPPRPPRCQRLAVPATPRGENPSAHLSRPAPSWKGWGPGKRGAPSPPKKEIGARGSQYASGSGPPG